MYKDIKRRYLEVRKTKPVDEGTAYRNSQLKAIFGGIVSDLQVIAKDKQVEILDDKDVITYMLKSKKSNQTKILDVVKDTNSHYVKQVVLEMSIFDEYLPKMLTAAEIREVILTNKLNTQREVMQWFNLKLAKGTFDNKLVMQVFNSLS